MVLRDPLLQGKVAEHLRLLLIVSTHTNKDGQKCSKDTFSGGFFNKFLEVIADSKMVEGISSEQKRLATGALKLTTEELRGAKDKDLVEYLTARKQFFEALLGYVQ